MYGGPRKRRTHRIRPIALGIITAERSPTAAESSPWPAQTGSAVEYMVMPVAEFDDAETVLDVVTGNVDVVVVDVVVD